jgi:protein-tyrosine phosphatase
VDFESLSRVLIVCTANVCRSPYAAAILESALSSELAPGHIQAVTAGTRAAVGAGICAEVSSLLGREERPVDAAVHRPSQVDRSTIESADLILAMELSQRSHLARISPAARRRTFTLLEALALATHLGSMSELGTPGASPEDRFRDFVAALNSLRGRVGPAVPARLPLWKGTVRAPLDPFDIPDGHTSTRRRHRLVLQQVGDAAAGFAEVLRPFCQ